MIIQFLKRLFWPIRLIHVWIAKLVLVVVIVTLSLWAGDLVGGMVWQWSVDLVALFLGIFVLAFPLVPAERDDGPEEEGAA